MRDLFKIGYGGKLYYIYNIILNKINVWYHWMILFYNVILGNHDTLKMNKFIYAVRMNRHLY